MAASSPGRRRGSCWAHQLLEHAARSGRFRRAGARGPARGAGGGRRDQERPVPRGHRRQSTVTGGGRVVGPLGAALCTRAVPVMPCPATAPPCIPARSPPARPDAYASASLERKSFHALRQGSLIPQPPIPRSAAPRQPGARKGLRRPGRAGRTAAPAVRPGAKPQGGGGLGFELFGTFRDLSEVGPSLLACAPRRSPEEAL